MTCTAYSATVLVLVGVFAVIVATYLWQRARPGKKRWTEEWSSQSPRSSPIAIVAASANMTPLGSLGGIVSATTASNIQLSISATTTSTTSALIIQQPMAQQPHTEATTTMSSAKMVHTSTSIPLMIMQEPLAQPLYTEATTTISSAKMVPFQARRWLGHLFGEKRYINSLADINRLRDDFAKAKTHVDGYANLALPLHVWQGNGLDPAVPLGYMFKPAVSTIRSALRTYRNISMWSVTFLIIGWGIMTKKSARDKLFEIVKPGDVFLWVGRANDDVVPWKQLDRQGTYTIYYQTEHSRTCGFPYVTNELWHFTWRNVDACAHQKKLKPKHIRYIPTGYLEGSPTAVQADRAIPDFIGDVKTRPCFSQLNAEFNNTVRLEHGVWGDKAFQKYIKNHSVHIMMHASCRYNDVFPKLNGSDLFLAQHKAVESFRLSQLLSAECLVIAQHSYPKDEEEFEGMVTFVNLSGMASEFRRLRSLSQDDRQKLASHRRDMYRRKFLPSYLFEKAGIYTLLDSLAFTQMKHKKI